MERQEIGRFYAQTFDENTIEFIVYNDNTIDCPILNIFSYNKIILKPRFIIVNYKKYYKYDVESYHYCTKSKLIARYDIDDQLFLYLKENKMISYSTDMAYLYGFIDKDGFDKKRYGVGSPYKWAKKKGSILVKQKNGNFN